MTNAALAASHLAALDEVERLKKLVMEAYDEGYSDGYGTLSEGQWETSNARAALEDRT